MGRRFRAVWVACTCVAAGALPQIAGALPLQNGGFESPLLADGAVVQTTPTHWSWGGPPGFLFNVVGTTGTAADGVQFVDIGNTSAFSLSQDFTVDADGRYQLAWYDNASAFAQVAPYRLTVSQGAAESAFDANEGIDATWNSRSVALDLLAGTTYTLTYSPLDIPGPVPAQDRFIDGVTISAVPEPSGAVLLLAGLAAFSAAARRRTLGGPGHVA